MTDPAADTPTLLDRMLPAGLGEEKARAHLAAGMARVEGETVTDPAALTPHGRRWVVASAN